jgi:hypothetical protein
MAKLVYSAITSLDGYIADKDGKFDWAVPDEEVLAFINDLERSRPRRPRLQGRFGRRVPVVPHTHRGGRRQTSSPR